MRVATWNVNGLRARLGLVLHWLRERRPDVVGLQELKLTDEQFPYAEIEAAGYRAAVHGQKGWNGVAVLSRDDATVVWKGLPGQEALGARLIGVDTGGVSFLTVYCPNGKHVGHEDFPRKLAWLDGLVEHVRTEYRPDRPVILCGDFNLCPTALDTWDEELLRGTIFHTGEERERFGRLTRWGLRDALREKLPDASVFSWWDYRGGAFHRGQGLRIDLLLVTECLMSRVQEVGVDREYRKKKEGLTPSDHAPVIADIHPGHSAFFIK